MNNYAVAILICRLDSQGMEHEQLYAELAKAHSEKEAYLMVLDNILMSNIYRDCYYKVVRYTVTKIVVI